jgi:hypothetical protein
MYLLKQTQHSGKIIHIYKIQDSGDECKRVDPTQKDVEVFLNTKETDILLMSEIHFMERNYITFPTYTAHANNYPDRRAHAGSAIIIRKDIKHHKLTKYETVHIQATNVSIGDWDGNLTTSAISCPPGKQLKEAIK